METQEHEEVLQRIAALFEYGLMSQNNQQQLAEIVSGIYERLEELDVEVYDSEERLREASKGEADAYGERWAWVTSACVEASNVLDDICHSFAEDIDAGKLLEGLKGYINVSLAPSTPLPSLASLLDNSGPVTISPVVPSVRSPYERGRLFVLEIRHKSPPLRSLSSIVSGLASDSGKKMFLRPPCRATIRRVIRSENQPDKLDLDISEFIGVLSDTVLMYHGTAVYSIAEVSTYYRPVDQEGFDYFVELHEIRVAASQSLKPRWLPEFMYRTVSTWRERPGLWVLLTIVLVALGTIVYHSGEGAVMTEVNDIIAQCERETSEAWAKGQFPEISADECTGIEVSYRARFGDWGR